jgi:hypothetical protein
MNWIAVMLKHIFERTLKLNEMQFGKTIADLISINNHLPFIFLRLLTEHLQE